MATIAVAAAQVWPQAKIEVGELFTASFGMLNEPWTWAIIVSIFVGWLSALIWSGMKVRELPLVRRARMRIPLHKALHYIAKDSCWAESYSGRDDHWVVGLSTAFQRALSLGQVTAFGYKRTHERVLSDGLTQLNPGFWSDARMDLSHIAAFHAPTRAVGCDGDFDFLEVDQSEVREAFPSRSKQAKKARASPVERIGNYAEMWATQDENYRKSRIISHLSVADRFYYKW